MFRAFILCFILAVCSLASSSLTSPAAAAAQVPLDEDGFTAYVANAFRKSHTDASVSVVGPLHLKVQRGTNAWSSYLFTLHSYCTRNPAACEASVIIHADQMATAHTDNAAPVEASALRVVVRQTAYVDQITAHLAGKGDPIVEPIAGDLWMVAVFDQPSTISVLKPSDLDMLNLSADAALARAKENTKAALARRVPLKTTDHDDISVLKGDIYEASLFAFPEIWAPLAKSYNDRLIVAVPGSDVMLFTSGARDDSVSTLAELAKATMQGEYRPFSAEIFRWTDKGWVAASR
jgi:hypothetical protein